MEITVVDDFEKNKKKCKRKKDVKKLLTGETVEVRITEEGFSGSWHSAIIIACGDSSRHVKYDHLLIEDGSKELTEWINVPSMIGDDFLINSRGLIRPFPPPLIEINNRFDLHYGLCVDALVNDAWWEGVIFDYKDGCLDRLVFFPDLGDQQIVKIDKLRITQDWDQVKESWKPRGNWVFLELIQEYEHERPVVVSVRQIWYELRAKEGFRDRIKEWTCSVKSIWADLVSETIRDNLEFVAEQVVNSILSTGSEVVSRGQEEGTDHHLAFSLLVDPVGNLSSESPTVFKKRRGKTNHSIHVLLDNQVEECTTNGLDFSCNRQDKNLISFDSCNLRTEVDKSLLNDTNRSCDDELLDMQIQDSSALPPDLSLFANVSSNSSHGKDDDHEATKVVMDYDVAQGNGNDPALDVGIDNCIISNTNLLAEANCTANKKIEHTSNTFRRADEVQGGEIVEDTRNSCWSKDDLIYDKHFDNPSRSRARGTRIWLPAPHHILPRAECCPEAVVNYLMTKGGKPKPFCINNLILQVRMHLSHLGWKIEWLKETKSTGSDGKSNTRYRLRYTSPEGKTEYSLHMVCKQIQTARKFHASCSRNDHESAMVDAPIYQLSSSPQQVPFSVILEKDQGCASLPIVEPLDSGIFEREVAPIIPVSDICAVIQEKGPKEDLRRRKDSSHTSQEILHMHSRQKRKATRTSHCRKLRKIKGSRFHLDSSYPTRFLLSSKRARQVSVQSPGHHNPRTVLSWLIENNVVLPLAKVRYAGRKSDQPLAEGRITRDGIKCNCCQTVFSMSSFEAHAGSKLCRPYGSIFLEDGRSLLDCQQQVVQDDKLRFSKIKQSERTKSNHVHKKNDYICSVCHYGGTLVLCDQCPSSFHLSCLGLEDLPDGKWFCPSCRCGICGQSEFHGDLEQSTENTVLCCDQCNREYHVGCIRKRGAVKPERSPEHNWFCSDKCEKICEGLHNLLGKSVSVGVDNLSWTVLKSTNDDVYHRFGASDIEAMIEHQSKLNVALGLMHECFEPINEPHTRRDLIKDVIFNNMSELNRLNFRGFYTVLLEKEDELISVATVRVHGEKVAEVPLVGTSVQYRRQGMCHILFDVLEKKLREIGVERLILPAAPQVLHTWTTSFGFSKMTNSERLEFLEYTFLDFQDATMCQKILRTITAKSTEPRDELPSSFKLKTRKITEEKGGRRAASSFTSAFHYFVTRLNASSIARPWNLTIPIAFGREHLPSTQSDLTLRNKKGNTWTVNCYVRDRKAQYALCGGWGVFARDNHLKEGDHLAFELVEDLVLQVQCLEHE